MGKNWFVDERLKEYRSVAKCGEPIVFIKYTEMDDLLNVEEFLDNPAEFDREIVSKLRDVFGKAIEGDRDAIGDISKICNPESEE